MLKRKSYSVLKSETKYWEQSKEIEQNQTGKENSDIF